MISARFSKDYGKGEIRLTVNGHAGQDEYGKDIVCAAASILTVTLAKAVSTYADNRKLKKKPNIRLDDGDAVITCKPGKDVFAEAFHTFGIIELGFVLLARAYPDYVEVTPFIAEE